MGLFPDPDVVEEIRTKWGGKFSTPPVPKTPEEAIPYLFWHLGFVEWGEEVLRESHENLKLAVTDPAASLARLRPYSWRTLFFYHHWVHQPLPDRPERWVYNKDRTKVVELPDAPPEDPAWGTLLQEIASAEGVHPTLTLHALLGWATTSVDDSAYKQLFRKADGTVER